MPPPIASAWKVMPTFESQSIQRTLDFYVEFLGFELASTEPEEGPPSEYTFCSIFAGEKAAANIYFFKPEGGTVKPGSAYIALGTEQLDMLYDAVKSQRSDVIEEEVEDKEWGFRQFAIKDPDGNKLTFFKFLEGGNPGTD
ncbi:glyoxalase family protein [Fusarium austroafricanum]|uniref:Glyoxalase family protein n=1 Tax=Fusarium austroafricanum TaxID=2364996 RepID=A0A8H4KKT1_9HYPO|nr:glyoxalase family protein [Fusarium austroafricanum]